MSDKTSAATPINGEVPGTGRLGHYEPGQVVWLRADEGSIGEGVIVNDQDIIIQVKFKEIADQEAAEQIEYEAAMIEGTNLGPPDPPQRTTPIVLNREQIALDRQTILDSEPVLEGTELEEIVNMATNQFAAEACRVLQAGEAYANTRWGEGTERAGAFAAAMMGALIGVGQGQIAGSPPACVGIADATARIVAISIMRQRGLDVQATMLAHTAGAPIREEDAN